MQPSTMSAHHRCRAIGNKDTMSGDRPEWQRLWAQAVAAGTAGDAPQAAQLYSQALAALHEGGSTQAQYRNMTLLVAAKARALVARRPDGWKVGVKDQAMHCVASCMEGHQGRLGTGHTTKPHQH
jgi:hypothetical protein